MPLALNRLKMSPFDLDRLELELVVHQDEAFYGRHIDSAVNLDADKRNRRILTGVYYFHETPKCYQGGQLRMHSIALESEGGSFTDIDPESDSALFFPSWFPHEVMKTSCPGKLFRYSRFAVNCWYHGMKGE